MPANNHFPANDHYFPAAGETSRLLVGCRREDYSASRIAHAVEDCDAHLLNLNIISMGQTDYTDFSDADSETAPSQVISDLRVSHRSPASVARSLERYGYTVLDMMSGDGDTDDTGDDVTRQRIDQLIRFLEI